MKKKTFEKLDGSNARNVVAGIINKKNAEESLLKDIDFIVYNVIEPNIKPSECKAFVKKHFDNIKYVKNEVHDNLDPEYLKSILSRRRLNNKYNIDGIVISHDEVYTLIANKNPKHSFAFKDNSFLDYKETSVIGIEWNVSKDGYVKPTILVEPIELSGVTIHS